MNERGIRIDLDRTGNRITVVMTLPDEFAAIDTLAAMADALLAGRPLVIAPIGPPQVILDQRPPPPMLTCNKVLGWGPARCRRYPGHPGECSSA